MLLRVLNSSTLILCCFAIENNVSPAATVCMEEFLVVGFVTGAFVSGISFTVASEYILRVVPANNFIAS